MYQLDSTFRVIREDFEVQFLALQLQDAYNGQEFDYIHDIFNFPPLTQHKSEFPEQVPSFSQTAPPAPHLDTKSQENETPQPQKKNRKDAHVFSQNISSKIKSLICKLLTGKNSKEFKCQRRRQYEAYLKEYKVQNNQMILIFAYLFLSQQNAPEVIYSQFRHQLLHHLEAKLQKEGGKDQKERQALKVKIKANVDILVYLFDLKRQGEIEWDRIRRWSQPLFQGRQKNRINSPLQLGKTIQKKMLQSKQIYRLTSNQQVLTQNQHQ